MNATANARFAIKSWDETPYSEGPNLPKMTKATVEKSFTGDIEGDSRVEYLMMYRSDGTALFVALERFTGRIGSKSGTFVLQRSGEFDGKQANESYTVVRGSGTGDLRGLTGEGASSVGHGADFPFVLRYSLPT